MKITHILVGYQADQRGDDALVLAGLLARTGDIRVTIAHVIPSPPQPPGPTKVDPEWRAYLLEQAEITLRAAAAHPALRGLHPAYTTVAHRGSGRGLDQLAGKIEADLIVIGSAPGGERGKIVIGSAADQLLHRSHVPVAVVPACYADQHPTALDRITVAYRKEPVSDAAAKLAASAAASFVVPLRLLTVMLHGPRPSQTEDRLMGRIRVQLEKDLAAATRGPRRRAALADVTAEVIEGHDAAEALAQTTWLPGELLICGSSPTGPIRRVFIGDMSLKILRAAPCPVLILPRPPKQ
ncbi:universal stress protein [Streptosporangiaceae bacterium NEAU-GS5]|nr:universal stress protein [Streptosporangiaceae bacterium NEAU-GS5]